MNKRSKRLVIGGVVLVLVLLVSFPFVRQAIIHSRRDREFKDLSLPASLTFVNQAKFGDLIDASTKEYGWGYTYSTTTDAAPVFEEVITTLTSSGYQVDRHNENSFTAYHHDKNLRIDGAISQYDRQRVSLRVRGIR